MLSQLALPIVAIATAPGRGAVGIVRVSGAQLEPLVISLCGRTLPARMATLLPLLLPAAVLAVYLPGVSADFVFCRCSKPTAV